MTIAKLSLLFFFLYFAGSFAKKFTGKHVDYFQRIERSDPEALHEVIVSVKKQNLDELERILLERSNPKSGDLFRKWLKFEEVRDLVQDHSAISKVKEWIRKENLELVRATIKEDYFVVKAKVGQWERILNTKFYEYKQQSRIDDAAEIRINRAAEYHLPSDIENDAIAIFNTIQFPPPPNQIATKRENLKKMKSNRRRLNSDDSEANFVTVGYLNSLYTINSNIGIDSFNQSVFETSNEFFSQQDLQSFQLTQGLTVQPAIDHDGHETSSCSTTGRTPNCFEGNLDIQYLMGVAQVTPTIYYYVDALDPFLAFVLELLDSSSPPLVNSISWGSSEIYVDPSVMDAFNEAAQELGVQGVTITVSTGDDGVSGSNCACSEDSSSSLTSWNYSSAWYGTGYFPSFPASSPYVTAVGATMGTNGAPTGVQVTCQANDNGVITSGGGFSTYYPQPSWQSDAVSSYFGDLPENDQPTSGYNPNGRGYPDVAMIGVDFLVVIDGQIFTLYGTSASSPTFASLVSLVNSALIAADKPPVGFMNQVLYQNALNFTDVDEGKRFSKY